MTSTNYFNEYDNQNIVHRIVANMCTLEVEYELKNKDIDIFYENCFGIYDYAKKYNPQQKGKILEYIVLQLSELVLDTFDELKEEYVKKGHKADELTYKLISYDNSQCKYFSKYLFAKKK